MKESYGEGVAIHTGPESCGGGSNAMAEALTGVRAGRPQNGSLRSALGTPRGHARDVRKWEVGQPHITREAPNNGHCAPCPAEVVEERGLANGNSAKQTRVWLSVRQLCTMRSTEYGRWQGWIRGALIHAPATSSFGALTRYYLRQEPSALVAHAGICAWGCGATRIPTATQIPAFYPLLYAPPSITKQLEKKYLDKSIADVYHLGIQKGKGNSKWQKRQ